MILIISIFVSLYLAELINGSQIDNHGEGMMEIRSINVGRAGKPQVHSVAILVKDNLGNQFYPVQKDTCVHHHFIAAVFVPYNFDQIVIIQLLNELL
jgi:hypothetical protein